MIDLLWALLEILHHLGLEARIADDPKAPLRVPQLAALGCGGGGEKNLGQHSEKLTLHVPQLGFPRFCQLCCKKKSFKNFLNLLNQTFVIPPSRMSEKTQKINFFAYGLISF